MPNHCSNQFTFTGNINSIQKLYHHIVNPDLEPQSIDFNRIIPMPDALDIPSDSSGMKALALLQMKLHQVIINTNWFTHAHQLVSALDKYGYQWHSLTAEQAIQVLQQEPNLQQHYDLDLELGQQYLSNLNQYGFVSWYEWRKHNWGTKWNAYNGDVELSEDGKCLSGYFDTAWSPAEPIYCYLAQHYPNVEINIEYLDEFADFAGSYRSDGSGQLIDYPLSDAEIEAMFVQHD